MWPPVSKSLINLRHRQKVHTRPVVCCKSVLYRYTHHTIWPKWLLLNVPDLTLPISSGNAGKVTNIHVVSLICFEIVPQRSHMLTIKVSHYPRFQWPVAEFRFSCSNRLGRVYTFSRLYKGRTFGIWIGITPRCIYIINSTQPKLLPFYKVIACTTRFTLLTYVNTLCARHFFWDVWYTTKLNRVALK